MNARCFQLECVRVMHNVLLVPVLKYGSETMVWKEGSELPGGGERAEMAWPLVCR